MVRALVFVAAAFLAGLAPAWGESPRHATDRSEQPAAVPAPPPGMNPLDVPKWMGDAIGHILSGEAPDVETGPTRR